MPLTLRAGDAVAEVAPDRGGGLGALRLGDRPVRGVMTPRKDVFWLAREDDEAQQRADIRDCPHSRLVVTSAGGFDEPLGVVHKTDLLDAMLLRGMCAYLQGDLGAAGAAWARAAERHPEDPRVPIYRAMLERRRSAGT